MDRLEVGIHLEGQLGEFSFLGHQVEEEPLGLLVIVLGNLVVLTRQVGGQLGAAQLVGLGVDRRDLPPGPLVEALLEGLVLVVELAVVTLDDHGEGLVQPVGVLELHLGRELPVGDVGVVGVGEERRVGAEGRQTEFDPLDGRLFRLDVVAHLQDVRLGCPERAIGR